LVLTQFPTASMVGGFRQWQAHGRRVRKGERGLMIWVPTSARYDGEAAPVPQPADAAPGEGEGRRSGFVMGTVFDISQTEPTPNTPQPDPEAAAIDSSHANCPAR
jgi:hypothetical protein